MALDRPQNTGLVSIENVNIYDYPKSIAPTPSDDTQITLGDLHGNAIKLIYTLIERGVMRLDENDFKALVDIYQKKTENLTKNDITQFNASLSNAKMNSHPLVRLIGDELADRGQNDFFTLKVLEKLKQEKLRIEIMLSNHSIEFLGVYEKMAVPPAAAQQPKNEFSVLTSLGPMNGFSMLNLGALIDKQLVTFDEIKEIVDKTYLPALKLVGWSKQTDSDIKIYTHAPVGLETIKLLATTMGTSYDDQTPDALAATIDKINRIFRNTVVKGKNVYSLAQIGPEADKQSYLFKKTEAEAFKRLVWMRYPKDGNAAPNEVMMPKEHAGYRVAYVHGHDGGGNVPAILQDRVTNLDNGLGKGPPSSNKPARYDVYMTQDQIKLDAKAHPATTPGAMFAQTTKTTWNMPKPPETVRNVGPTKNK